MNSICKNVTKILSDLVAFDTTSRNSNLALVQYIAEYLARFGLKPKLILSEDGNKANLYVTIGPQKGNGIVLSGHTDVVPVDGQNWSTPPFELTKKGELLYGRGTADMKGFIACTLAMTPKFLKQPLTRPIHLAFSYDEEVGCLGVGKLIEFILSETAKPDAIIVGEPTTMKIATTHKGICAMSTLFHGREGHSSQPENGINSIEAAAEFIKFLYWLSEDLSKKEADNRFDPPYTTFNVGKIMGGEAVNIIAQECILNWEFRPIPGADAQKIIDRVDQWVKTHLIPRMSNKEFNCLIETIRDVFVPPFDLPNSTAEKITRTALGTNRSEALSFVTEASLYAKAGFPAVICGPGNIAQAHQADEFVSVKQLSDCMKFLDKIIRENLHTTT